MPVLLFSAENRKLVSDIASETASHLGYQTLNDSYLNDIARKHELDPAKLKDAMHQTPSILRRMPSKLWYYWLACVEMEVLERLIEDQYVCWGLGAHLYVLVVSHILKVRLIGGDDGDGQIDEKKIRQRDKWAMAAWKHKESEPRLYDQVINLDQIKPKEVVSNVAATLQFPRFKPMTYSKNNLTDRLLAARVKQELLKTLTDIDVHANNGTVVVTTTSLKREKAKKTAAIKSIAEKVEGIGYLEVHWKVDLVNEAAVSYR